MMFNFATVDIAEIHNTHVYPLTNQSQAERWDLEVLHILYFYEQF